MKYPYVATYFESRLCMINMITFTLVTRTTKHKTPLWTR